ncbi:MAG: exonuclease [Bdellovibrionaceae bacterium]|nr:exonuclease [Pseudobdellovibrionaceae bacterium]MBC7457019.1 exonuclease [Pseudobdellovibrionaceae bacterium]
MNFDKKSTWEQYPVVAFDTETSGPYPLESEIIELGAVKWYKGEIVEKFQTLLKPSKLLVEDNIRIHGITNEMVADAPLMKDQIAAFREFIDGSILLAHHAPFDLGFLTIDIENAKLHFPNNIHLCTSLLSRALLATTNHKLQTLVKELKLTGGDAHRAYDDAYACLQVFFKCTEKLDAPVTLERLLDVQKKSIGWINYKISESDDQKILRLAQAIRGKQSLNIIYEGGQTKGKPRPIIPHGIVRNPDGDYINAECGLDNQRKRFYIGKILEITEG